ncbi:unnamed protein product [Euphydryas editha]|uniref:Uncharacterized protein n=1 Tax=Euphydryas editha TaxID=104508 RepID=A0AAU9UC99_EUPED|nr:unnamed protein product [Euphydryas editha]
MAASGGDAPHNERAVTCVARNMRSLNVTACAALLADVRWNEPTSVASLAVLALIDVLVIAGNIDICNISIIPLYMLPSCSLRQQLA